MLVATFGLVWLGETLSPVAWGGIGLICSGVFGTALAVRGHASRSGVALALANAAVIATYTLIDGAGVRVSGAPVSYILWLFLLNAIPLLAWALLFRRRAFFAYLRGNLPIAFVGGVVALYLTEQTLTVASMVGLPTSSTPSTASSSGLLSLLCMCR